MLGIANYFHKLIIIIIFYGVFYMSYKTQEVFVWWVFERQLNLRPRLRITVECTFLLILGLLIKECIELF